MKFQIKAITLSITTLIASIVMTTQSYAGREAGNGGDMCENRIKSIRDDISSWIAKGGAKPLQLPAGITYAQYLGNMNSSFSRTQISCTDKQVFLGTAQKTCINFKDGSGLPQIMCDFNRFNKTSEGDQYVLVHHEYAGISGFEVNVSTDSYYTISNQISAFLEEQIVKKLVVKPAQLQQTFDSSGFAPISNRGIVDALRTAVNDTNLSCFDSVNKTRWTIKANYYSLYLVQFNQMMDGIENLISKGYYTLHQHQSAPIIAYFPVDSTQAFRDYESKCGASWEEHHKRCPNFDGPSFIDLGNPALPKGTMKFVLSMDHSRVVAIEYDENRVEQQTVKVHTSITDPAGQSTVINQTMRDHWLCQAK